LAIHTRPDEEEPRGNVLPVSFPQSSPARPRHADVQKKVTGQLPPSLARCVLAIRELLKSVTADCCRWSRAVETSGCKRARQISGRHILRSSPVNRMRYCALLAGWLSRRTRTVQSRSLQLSRRSIRQPAGCGCGCGGVNELLRCHSLLGPPAAAESRPNDPNLGDLRRTSAARLVGEQPCARAAAPRRAQRKAFQIAA
jgi:hypothetical protein